MLRDIEGNEIKLGCRLCYVSPYRGDDRLFVVKVESMIIHTHVTGVMARKEKWPEGSGGRRSLMSISSWRLETRWKVYKRFDWLSIWLT